jgi:hypothetical protein
MNIEPISTRYLAFCSCVFLEIYFHVFLVFCLSVKFVNMRKTNWIQMTCVRFWTCASNEKGYRKKVFSSGLKIYFSTWKSTESEDMSIICLVIVFQCVVCFFNGYIKDIYKGARVARWRRHAHSQKSCNFPFLWGFLSV